MPLVTTNMPSYKILLLFLKKSCFTVPSEGKKRPLFFWQNCSGTFLLYISSSEKGLLHLHLKMEVLRIFFLSNDWIQRILPKWWWTLRLIFHIILSMLLIPYCLRISIWKKISRHLSISILRTSVRHILKKSNKLDVLQMAFQFI